VLLRWNSTGVANVMKRQLQTLTDKRKNRSQRPSSELVGDKADLALMEEMEDRAGGYGEAVVLYGPKTPAVGRLIEC
jgi:hypothetical protein